MASITLKAQSLYDTRTWSVTAKVGPTQFYGDLSEGLAVLSPVSFFKAQGFELGLGINKHLNRTFTIKGDIDFASIKASRKQWYNARFSSKILQTSLVVGVDMMHIFYPDVNVRRQKLFVEPYVGFGLIGFKSTVNDIDTQRYLRSTDFLIKKVIPIGLCFRQDITPSTSVGLDFRMNTVFSDVLDGTIGGVLEERYLKGLINDDVSLKKNSAKDRWSSLTLCYTYKIGGNGRKNARTFK